MSPPPGAAAGPDHRPRADAGGELVLALDRLAFAAVGATAHALLATPEAVDLTVTQWRALALLQHADRPLRIGEIGATIGASLPSTSRLVDRLRRRGLVESAPDGRDRRARRVELTPIGVAVVGAVLASRRGMIATAAASLDGALPAGTAPAMLRLARALDAAAGDVAAGGQDVAAGGQ